MNVKVAIWSLHPGDLLGQAIDFVTHGPAQHAGFIRGNGMVHELYMPQVRDRALTPAELPYVRTFDLAGLTDDLSAKLERHFDAYLSAGITQYSIEDLFRIVLNLPKPPDGQMVCSQYVFHQLKMIGLPPLVRCDEDFISPRDLLISPNLMEA
jgi:hypothetical protein